MTLSEYITKYRAEHELSGRQFAALVGISPQYEVNLERGTNNHGNPVSPSMKVYSKIAKGTGISEIDLLSMLDDEVSVNPPLSDQDIRLLEWFRSLPEEKQKAILISQDAPEGLV